MILTRAIVIALSLSVGALALTVPDPAPATYPGTNGRVAFTSLQDGGARHIFVKTSTGIRDLTGASSPAAETQPKFSPDGREIAFTRAAQGLPASEIFVMSASGRGRTQLTDTPYGNSDPTWSPDGTQIAFVSSRHNDIPNIFIMRSDGSDVRQITHDRATESELAWSPRGGRIAFVREPARGGDCEIYSIKTNGSGLTDLSRDPNNFDLDPAFSPDGSRIAYSGPLHPGHESVGADLWIMNATGSNQHPLHHEGNGYSDGAYPAWSPDGTTIAFTANYGTGYYHVWSVAATGGQNTELVANSIAGGNPIDQEVDWQPLTSAKPGTKITRAKIRKRMRLASFVFAATGPATGYWCALRGGRRRVGLRKCSAPEIYKHLKPGSYTFEVRAFGPGEPYHALARRKFTIPRRHHHR